VFKLLARRKVPVLGGFDADLDTSGRQPHSRNCMQDTPDQVGRGDVAIEYRGPRFAELDAQIQAEKAARQQRPATRKRKSQRARPPLPREVRKEIAQCAQQLRQHRKLFIADAKLKDRVARFLRSLLPPKRKRGRPPLATVSRAIVLLKRLIDQDPHEKCSQRWKRIYPQVILDYANLTREQQRAQVVLLRDQVRSRRNQKRHRHSVGSRNRI
jgi:hypothetical protein